MGSVKAWIEYYSYSYKPLKRKAKVKVLAGSRTIKVTEDQTTDPALLFQKFLVHQCINQNIIVPTTIQDSKCSTGSQKAYIR